ncbi:MAG: hypothetical protein ACRC9Z_10405 [Weissella confusa]
MNLKKELRNFVKLVLTPRVLNSFGFGFMAGGLYTAWSVTKGVDTGSIPDWIAAAATVFAGLWAYFTFRKTDDEHRDADLDGSLISENKTIFRDDFFDDYKVFRLTLLNNITKPTNVKAVYLNVESFNDANENVVDTILSMNRIEGESKLMHEDSATYEISFSNVYNSVTDKTWTEGTRFEFTPRVILAHDEFKTFEPMTLTWQKFVEGLSIYDEV